MNVTPLPEVVRPLRLLDCVGNDNLSMAAIGAFVDGVSLECTAEV